MSLKKERVVVLGASPKPQRYSNQAVRLLVQCGHEVVPVNPAQSEIEGVPVVSHLEEIDGAVDTVTMYVSPKLSAGLGDALVNLRPARVIFNPGTESEELKEQLTENGIKVEEACTLVMLKTGQF